MKQIISNFCGSLALFHLITGIYLLFTEANQNLFFTVFFIGMVYTLIFLQIENSKNNHKQANN